MKKSIYQSIDFSINNQNGKVKVSLLFSLDQSGLLHHPDLPALMLREEYQGVNFDHPGYYEIIYYYHHGLLFREKKPAYIGKGKQEKYSESFHYHEKKELKSDRSLISKNFLDYIASHQHSYSDYFASRKLLINNIDHGEGGNPGCINVNEENEYIWYKKNGIMHREEGPAYLFKTKGKVNTQTWYLEGKIIS